MEVHHHPNVEKKNFKEYLLEGLMIFLAVSMGFIAENIRENLTEHHKAKLFAESMLKDIEADTAQLYSFKQFEKSDIIIIMENEKHYREEATKLIALIKKEYN
jgi:hypothetical protein